MELEKRLKKSTNRPLLKNVDLAEKVKELDIARRKYYLLSDIIIQNNNGTFFPERHRKSSETKSLGLLRKSVSSL